MIVMTLLKYSCQRYMIISRAVSHCCRRVMNVSFDELLSYSIVSAFTGVRVVVAAFILCVDAVFATHCTRFDIVVYSLLVLQL